MSKDKINTGLLDASVRGNTEQVRKILDTVPSADITDGCMAEAFTHAAYYRYTDILRLFLEHNVDPNIAGSDGDTALTWAAYNGYTDIVGLLLEYGADINGAGSSGDTALIKAVCRRHTDTVLFLIGHGADVNAADNNGQTALMYAAVCGHTKLMDMLIKAGADVNAANNKGQTAFDILKGKHPDKYNGWINDIAVKMKCRRLRKEDAPDSIGQYADWDI